MIPASALFPYIWLSLSRTRSKTEISASTFNFSITGKIFDQRRFNEKSKTFPNLDRLLLLADNVDLVVHSEEDMQYVMDLFSNEVCNTFRLTICLQKTKTMITSPPGQTYVEPNILIKTGYGWFSCLLWQYSLDR